MDDTDLVRKAKNGSHFAFVQLVEKHQRSLYCTALGILGSSWDAYDALQETMLRAFVSLNSLKEDGSFKFWLTQILVNKCYDQLRKTKRVFPVEYIQDTPYEFSGHEEQMDLLDAMGRLDKKYRLILGLRYFQDLPIKEIASILGCPAGTVKSRLNQALKELRKELSLTDQGEAIK